MLNIAISARKISSKQGKNAIFSGFDVDLPQGQWTSVVGPNGAGKSTLLKILAGLHPHEGQVALLGTPLAQWPRRDLAKTRAWMGQNQPVNADLSVYDVAMLGRLAHQHWLGSPRWIDHEAVQLALEQTNAWAWRDRSVSALSGGERQRVLLARVLAVQAQVVLMDEPLAHLDPSHQADWIRLVRELVSQGITVVSALHEINPALHANQVLVLNQGTKVYMGSPSDQATHQAIENVFAGKVKVISTASAHPSNQQEDDWFLLLNPKR